MDLFTDSLNTHPAPGDRCFCCSATVPTEGQLIVPERERLDMYVIGNEAGFFPSIVGPRRSLLLGPAERYDVIVDFSQLKEGVGPVYLLNEGPEVPYNGTNNGELLTPHTAQVRSPGACRPLQVVWANSSKQSGFIIFYYTTLRILFCLDVCFSKLQIVA